MVSIERRGIEERRRERGREREREGESWKKIDEI